MINKKDHLKAWLPTVFYTQSFGKSPRALILISEDENNVKKTLKAWPMSTWSKEHISEWGPVEVISLSENQTSESSWPELNGENLWTSGFMKTGEALRSLENHELENLEVHLLTQQEDLMDAVLCALEVYAYRFKGVSSKFKKVRILLNGVAITAKRIKEASILGHSANWARHLVNLPPNALVPATYAQLVKDLFANQADVKVEIWDEKRLAKENCGLHLAVGQGSVHPPRLVKISYRPKGGAKNPIAFVGKGVTFDSGGLDIKPSSGMRLMKKDMGGSAAVVGTLFYAVQSKLKVSVDAYLALAENSVSERAFRPSDLITSRSGQVVEIHNTDAEGRLVMADALDVAATQKDKPHTLVDVSTLTGAIKVALGAKVAGLFSNQTVLSQSLFQSFCARGDDVWPMPLYSKYKSQMNTPFADMTNAVDGFGGAVTAALFLEKFVKGLPWAHLDIYAWKDSAEGPFAESGGSGQAVLGLTQWLRSFEK